MSLWPYVDDQVLVSEIKLVLDKFQSEVETIDIYSNVLDPFSAIFDIAKQKITFEEWISQERLRQSQKTLQNLVGYFHQHILGHVDGWSDSGQGGSYDLISEDKRIIVELKNKHNTMNSSSSSQTYRKMAGHLDGDKKGYQGYVVMIVPKHPVRSSSHFSPNDSGKPVRRRDDLLYVDGATIYEIVTGDELALKKLFNCLPKAIDMAFPAMNLGADAALKTKLTELFTLAFGS